MQTHLIQLDIAWESKAKNFDRVRDLVERTSTNPGDLIVLPELFDVGFTLNTKVAHDNGDTLAFLQSLSNDTRCLVHGSRALLPQDQTHAFNCASICAPSEPTPICEYQKVHPFSFGREGEAYIGGNALQHYPWGELRVCPAICYDLRFPELFRAGLRKGTQVFALGANWPSPRQHHWRALSIARAIENQAFVLAVNRTGSDPHLNYSGGSIAIGPKGDILGELNDQPGTLSVEIDPQSLHDWRHTFPAWRDMRL